MKRKGIFSYKANSGYFLRQVLILGIALSLTSTLFLSFSIPKTIYAAERLVEVGVLAPISGPVAPLGIQAYRGFELGVDEINGSGGIKSLGGAKINITLADTRSSKDVAVTALERLIRKDVCCVVSGAGSGEGMVTGPVSEKSRMPMLLVVAVQDDILQTSFMKYVFRVTNRGQSAGRDIIRSIAYIRDKSGVEIKNIAEVYEHGGFGIQFHAGIEKNYKEFGFNLVGAFPHPTGITDLMPIMTKVKALQPDFLIGNGYTGDSILLIRTLKELKLNLKGYKLTTGPAEKVYRDTLKKDGDYAFGSLYWHEGSIIPGVKPGRCQEVANQFRQKYGFDLEGYGARGFTTAYLIKDALERCGSTDREKLRDAIAKTDLTAQKGNIMPYERIKFDERGENTYANCPALQLLKGKVEMIWPEEFSTAKFVFPVPKWEERD